MGHQVKVFLQVAAIGIWASLISVCGAQSSKTSYVGAVYAHQIIGTIGRHRPSQILDANLWAYEKAMGKASKQGAQIIVFPEYGLIPTKGLTNETIEPFLQQLPTCDGTYNPCENSQNGGKSSSEIVTRLSCMSQKNSIYTVINIGERKPCIQSEDPNCPKRGYYKFNSNIIFDNTGTLVTCYRKIQLYKEYHFDSAKFEQKAVFKTDFGTFTTAICFDILFEEIVKTVSENNVTDLLLSSLWMDQLPFLSFNQVIQSWSVGKKINVLASNLYNPAMGAAGAGIAQAGQKMEYLSACKVKDNDLLVANITNIKEYSKYSKIKCNPEYSHKNMYIEKYSLKKLKVGVNITEKVCHSEICCKVTYSVDKMNSSFYLGAFSGLRASSSSKNRCEQVCILVQCLNDCKVFDFKSETIFQDITLEGTINSKTVFPSILLSNMKLLKPNLWKFEQENNLSKITTAPGIEIPLVSANLYGRCYDQDVDPII